MDKQNTRTSLLNAYHSILYYLKKHKNETLCLFDKNVKLKLGQCARKNAF